MIDPITVLVTCPDREEADTLAEMLVRRKLAACVQVLPGIVSTYFWQGDLCRDEEVLMVIKSGRERFEALRRFIKETHSYEVPQIVALPVVAADSEYLKWMESSLK